MAANKAATDSKMAAPAPAPAPAAPAPVVGLGGAIQDASDLGPYEDLKPDDEKPQSLISHLVSSLSSGQDLTRVLIPTFFLEPRSFLEKFTDLWAHPQLILGYDSFLYPPPHSATRRLISTICCAVLLLCCGAVLLRWCLQYR